MSVFTDSLTTLDRAGKEIKKFIGSFKGKTFPQIVKGLVATGMGKCLAISLVGHIVVICALSINYLTTGGALEEQKAADVKVPSSGKKEPKKSEEKKTEEKQPAAKTPKEVAKEEAAKRDAELQRTIEEEDAKKKGKIRADQKKVIETEKEEPADEDEASLLKDLKERARHEEK